MIDYGARPAKDWDGSLSIIDPGEAHTHPEAGTPFVTIVIPCFNQAKFLDEAIQSALSQSYPSIEVLVIDDGSTDTTAEVARPYAQVRYLRQSNQGPSAARNLGVRESIGVYVIFLDADDRLLPDAVKDGVGCMMDNPSCLFVYGGYRNFDDSGTRPADTRIFCDVRQALLEGNCIGMVATVLWRRDVLEQNCGFDVDLRACEDYELYLRLSGHGTIVRHGNVVAEYREHPASNSRSSSTMLRGALAVLRKYRPSIDSAEHASYRRGLGNWKQFYCSRAMGRLLEGVRSRSLHWGDLQTIIGLFAIAPVTTLRSIAKGTGRRVLHRITATLPIRAGQRLNRMKGGGIPFRNTKPLSRRFGYDRGTPIDRRYIEAFLQQHSSDIRGRVLEIGDSTYTRRFGGNGVSASEVLHVEAGHPGCTLVADLSRSDGLPVEYFDCVIITQTLQFIFDLSAVVSNLHRMLVNGGVVLATVPTASPVARDQPDPDSDYWRFTASGVRHLFGREFGERNVEVSGYGNVLAMSAFLYGMSAEELRPEELQLQDADYPLIVAARCEKRAI